MDHPKWSKTKKKYICIYLRIFMYLRGKFKNARIEYRKIYEKSKVEYLLQFTQFMHLWETGRYKDVRTIYENIQTMQYRVSASLINEKIFI